MSTEIQFATNAIKAKLINPTDEVKVLLTDLLSYYVKGYENTYSFKNGTWDGRSTMFDWRTETFPVGFISVIGGHLMKLGYRVIVLSNSLPEPLGHVPKVLGGFSYTDRYDYQWQTVEALLKRGIMIARLSTGAGKTFAAALCTAKINRPTLILTKRQPLLYQFWDRMKDFGFDPGIVGDNRMLIKPDLTIAMSQTLIKRLECKDDLYEPIKDYLNKVEFIIGEEVHEISDNSYWNIIQNCPNAYYRLGLTATPFMKDKSESNMRLLGGFGPVGIDVSEKVLIDRGINAKPIFKFATYEKPSKLRFTSNYQKAVFEGITHCKERNKIIIEHVIEAAKKNLPVLVLVQRKEHGNVLLANLKDTGLKTEYIWGETDNDKRQESLNNLVSRKTEVLIGSTILDVGVDVPAIGLVVMAGGGKAEVSYRQRIGRGLREKKTGSNVCFILDFEDSWNTHLNNHYLERLKVIKSTPGFSEGLIRSSENFPWEL